MIVDDVFTTLGSANINERSMSSDSELNICVEDPAVARPLRKHLWGLHTGEEDEETIKKAFNKWQRLLDANKARRLALHNKPTERPACSLVEFLRVSPSRKDID